MAASDALATMSAKAKEVEDEAKEIEDKIHSATTTQRATAEEDVARARTSAAERSQELREKIEQTKTDAASRWRDVQESWDRHVQQIRSSIGEKRHEMDVKQAAKQADLAESDAEFAVAHAMAAIEEAEYTVLEAVLARDAADKLKAGG
ncbi:hypothetical protein ACQPXB_21710 [Amycolatopsis sp. CA-161197]|uniref:hypothetical protein n=1 Tax=Amycolatopsis sp. CA-161197 TaxID=3239922 RepID=UPI003D924B6B